MQASGASKMRIDSVQYLVPGQGNKLSTSTNNRRHLILSSGERMIAWEKVTEEIKTVTSRGLATGLYGKRAGLVLAGLQYGPSDFL